MMLWFAVIGGVGMVGLTGLVLGLARGRSLFGPILFYDLLRSARRGRHVLLRCLYLAALLVVLFLLYAKWFGGGRSSFSIWKSSVLHPNQLAAFAEAFFETFAAVQYAIVVLITPACTAGAIAEEKERKTLDYLLASDLRPRDIVLGKLVSRLAYLTLLVLTGLPVLSFLQLLGGVDPQLVLASFAATAMTMVSLASLSMLNSVLASRARTAILLTYMQVAAYLIATTVLYRLTGGKGYGQDWISSGNILVALQRLTAAVTIRGGLLKTALSSILGGYLTFHGVLTVVCLSLSTSLFLAWHRWQASRRARRSFAITFRPRPRPPVGEKPMLWKELYAEPLFRFSRNTMAVVGAFWYSLLLLGAFIFLSLIIIGLMLRDLPGYMNSGVRWVGTPVACAMLLAIALRAASSISGERDRQTLDSLLSSPLSNTAILRAKWWGSVASVRRMGWNLGAIWGLGVVTGGLSVLAVPLLVAAWFIQAAFLASLGLVCSLVCRTATRAIIWMLLIIAGLNAGHWLYSLFYTPRHNWGEIDYLFEVQSYGLTPPLTLHLLSFHDKEAETAMQYLHDFWIFYWGNELLMRGFRLLAAFAGLICLGIAAFVLRRISQWYFRRATGRMPLPPDHRQQLKFLALREKDSGVCPDR